jgi:hypothetical protein
LSKTRKTPYSEVFFDKILWRQSAHTHADKEIFPALGVQQFKAFAVGQSDVEKENIGAKSGKRGNAFAYRCNAKRVPYCLSKFSLDNISYGVNNFCIIFDKEKAHTRREQSIAQQSIAETLHTIVVSLAPLFCLSRAG